MSVHEVLSLNIARSPYRLETNGANQRYFKIFPHIHSFELFRALHDPFYRVVSAIVPAADVPGQSWITPSLSVVDERKGATVNDISHSRYRITPGPVHAILLGGAVPLFLGGLLSDIAYFSTYQIQWSNFAAWLIAGGLLFSGLALLFALVNLLRAPRKSGRPSLYLLLLLVTWLLGLTNAFEHAKDAWEAMPSSLVLSIIVTLLSVASAWTGLTNLRSEAVQ